MQHNTTQQLLVTYFSPFYCFRENVTKDITYQLKELLGEQYNIHLLELEGDYNNISDGNVIQENNKRMSEFLDQHPSINNILSLGMISPTLSNHGLSHLPRIETSYKNHYKRFDPTTGTYTDLIAIDTETQLSEQITRASTTCFTSLTQDGTFLISDNAGTYACNGIGYEMYKKFVGKFLFLHVPADIQSVISADKDHPFYTNQVGPAYEKLVTEKISLPDRNHIGNLIYDIIMQSNYFNGQHDETIHTPPSS